MSRSFRYGTSLMPTVAKNIIDKVPPHLQLVDPAQFSVNGKRQHPDERFVLQDTVKGRYPSVSAIIAATDDLGKLYRWQLKMMEQMGIPSFKKHMLERAQSGTDFHSTIQKIMKVIQKDGTISDADCRRIICESRFPQNVGFCQGILPLVHKIKKTEWMSMERKTVNHYLCYQGKYDAIIELDGEPTLVDWKTVSSASIKSTSEGHSLDQLFSNPLQIVAYVNAVNTDPAYKDMPKIKRGAVVLAFEDGRPAEIVSLGEDDIKQYTEVLIERANKFWWKMEHPTKREIVLNNVDFVYNPTTLPASEPMKKVEVVENKDDVTVIQLSDSDSDVEVIGTLTVNAAASRS